MSTRSPFLKPMLTGLAQVAALSVFVFVTGLLPPDFTLKIIFHQKHKKSSLTTPDHNPKYNPKYVRSLCFYLFLPTSKLVSTHRRLS